MRRRRRELHGARWAAVIVSLGLLGCNGGGGENDDTGALTIGVDSGATDGSATAGTDGTADAGTSGDGDGDATGDGDGDTDPTGDGDGDTDSTGDGDGDGDADACEPIGNLAAPPSCAQVSQPGSFAPVLQWAWDGDPQLGYTYVIATPLVGNLTDDNNDGVVDLCDTPDVVVVAFHPDTLTDPNLIYGLTARIYILDGATGALHTRFEDPMTWLSSPALADIDQDGEMEIIASRTVLGNVTAWNPDGTKVQGFDFSFAEGTDPAFTTLDFATPVSVYDLDGDGSPEILIHRYIFNAQGQLLETLDVTGVVPYNALVVADLDQDGAPEIISGRRAWTWDNGSASLYYDANIGPGHVQIGDLVGDAAPEILVTGPDGFSVLDAQGQVLLKDQRPVSSSASALAWQRPATIHDFDGDGRAEFAFSVADSYLLVGLEDAGPGVAPTVNLLGQWDILDASGIAGSTAFDFLGDGSAEAMYADEETLYVWETSDPAQAPYVSEPRSSRTLIEYPVVADVDGDGSAEIVVVSNEDPLGGGATAPAVQVYGDMFNRWVPARRIWNQSSYHVTNVNEDGTIPTTQLPYWETFKSFRTNTQLENGVACVP